MNPMFVDLVDFGGTDLSVVNAARASFEKESDWEWNNEEKAFDLPSDDAKLIRYLAKHNHWTPFAHTWLSFRIKAPIFVARQLGKHQVGLVWNEVSRRYVASEPEFYFPEVWREKAENVKQGSSENPVPFCRWHNHLGEEFTVNTGFSARIVVDTAVKAYEQMLAAGVCPEQARMILPQNMMTTWVWSGNVASFARVCNLRLDPHTQAETRAVANRIAEWGLTYFPTSWKALVPSSAS